MRRTTPPSVGRVRRIIWLAGAPMRGLLLLAIRGYQVSLGQFLGGRCRFYPSCSEYAGQAIAELGLFRGGALAGWRLLRCSPLSPGGVDHPPKRKPEPVRLGLYDDDIQRANLGSRRVGVD